MGLLSHPEREENLQVWGEGGHHTGPMLPSGTWTYGAHTLGTQHILEKEGTELTDSGPARGQGLGRAPSPLQVAVSL